jgi:GNAT superfamily N-acetyltransferase
VSFKPRERPALELRPEPPDSPVGSALVQAFIDWAKRTYPEYDPARSPSADPDELSPPGGVFLVAWLGRDAVGAAGFKRLDAQTAEVKRLYVAPEARGAGVGRALMLRLEDEARATGYSRLWLDIGDRQPEAMALYTGLGYTEIDDYNGNPFASYWLGKRL